MEKEALKQKALQLGFSAVGVTSADAPVHLDFYRRWLDRGFGADMEYLAKHAELKADVRHLLPSATSVVAVALDYNQELCREAHSPRIARYALGRDYHKVLTRKLKQLSVAVQDAHPTAELRICVDSAPILEREIAHLAGLGWFGKNTCLIDSKRGSWFFIGFLLTSLWLEPDTLSEGGCGTCRACIDACPTGAIVFEDGRWQVDSRNCISYLTIEHRGAFSEQDGEKLHGWTFGCDICQEVCPFNQPRPSQPSRGAFAKDRDLLRTRAWPSLKELAQIEYNQWSELTAGSATRRAGFEGLVRNAKVNVRMAEKSQL